MLGRPKPLVLLFLDGFGYSLDEENDAILGIEQPAEMAGRSLVNAD